MDSGLTLHPSAAPRLMTRHCRADKTNSFVRVLDLVRRQQLKFDRAQAYRSHNSQAGLLPQNRVCRRSFLHSVAILLASSRVQLPAQAILVEENVTDRVFQVAAPSVVAVVNMREQRGVTSQDSEASGFVWDARGFIVTNYHCIQPVLNDRSNTMYTVVQFESQGEKKEFRTSVWATDASHDLAVLQIDAPSSSFTPIKVGSSKSLKVGQSVFSIGCPYGFSKTFTAGVVSGLNRGVPSPVGSTVTGVIQTDASISSGNSGGPLLDSRGRLVGISTATFNSNKSMGRGSGVNFAIPVDTLLKRIPNMIVYQNASGKGV